MDELYRDLRYALRGLRRSPAFTLVAVVTIALGIGVNSTIFSLVNAVLLRPLSVPDSDRLVNVYGRPANTTDHSTVSYPDYLDYRSQTETLSGLAGYTNFFANLSIEGSSELVVGELVTDGYFDVLATQPALGRAFTSDEFVAPGAAPVAILSHPFWRARFGGDPGVVGRTLRLNGRVFTVVGVAPEGFGGMFPAVTAQMWLPLSMVDEVTALGEQRGSGFGDASRLERRSAHFLWLVGRMRPDVELERVRSEMETLAARLAERYPETNGLERSAVLATNDVAINPDFDSTLNPVGMVLLGAVALVLLVACANLANMMLARASARRREIAVRAAIGARRGRLMRQMLTESTVLALLGGGVAMALSVWLTRLVGRLQPPLPIDLGLDITPDWRVLLFTLGVAAATGVVFGLVPALRSSRPDLVPALKDAGDGAVARKRLEARDALVVAQVAVSLVLLIAGALIVRSLSVARQVDLGYDVDRIAYLGLAMDMNGYLPEQTAVFVEEGARRLAALPGVEAVGQTSRIPLSLNNNGFGVFIDGHQASAEERPYITDGAYVDEAYFEALDLDIVQGRAIERADRDEARRVAVVTREMADRHWPGMDPIGREFRTSWGGEPWSIVGVVQDYKVDTPGEAPKPYLHLPLAPRSGFVNYLVRSSGPVAGEIGVLERELRALDPDLVFLDTGPVRELADVRLFPVRAGAWLIGAFGVLALLVASVGLYGVIAYSVSRRLREIGVRMAMGAEPGSVVGLVLGFGLKLVGVGALVGIALAVLAARAVSAILFVAPFDPIAFLGATVLLGLVAVVANAVPALRAARVDPMVVLRSD